MAVVRHVLDGCSEATIRSLKRVIYSEAANDSVVYTRTLPVTQDGPDKHYQLVGSGMRGGRALSLSRIGSDLPSPQDEEPMFGPTKDRSPDEEDDTEDGEAGFIEDEDKLFEAIQKQDPPSRIMKAVRKELSEDNDDRLQVLNYLRKFPWGERSKREDLEYDEVIEALNTTHYGLDKVKQRVAEQLVVWKRAPDHGAPNLALVGPPGTGKSTIARCISDVLGRSFENIPLTGVDHAGALNGEPRVWKRSRLGRAAETVIDAGSLSPVVLLDEVDKLDNSSRNPESALISMLDDEQNDRFYERYLGVEIDLSDVFFVLTANELALPKPLEDRLEIIDVPGYSPTEKQTIAREYILPDLRDEYGVNGELTIDDSVIQTLIDQYSQEESGVRKLQDTLETLCRKALIHPQLDPSPDDLDDLLFASKDNGTIGFDAGATT